MCAYHAQAAAACCAVLQAERLLQAHNPAFPPVTPTERTASQPKCGPTAHNSLSHPAHLALLVSAVVADLAAQSCTDVGAVHGVHAGNALAHNLAVGRNVKQPRKAAAAAHNGQCSSIDGESRG